MIPASATPAERDNDQTGCAARLDTPREATTSAAGLIISRRAGLDGAAPDPQHLPDHVRHPAGAHKILPKQRLPGASR